MAESLEFTTSIPIMGCPVRCKYCPWKEIAERYNGPRHLTLEQFKRFISTIPDEKRPYVRIQFGGLSEPHLNPETTDMILYAHELGHPIIDFTVLSWLTKEDCERLKDVPFENFIVHLPDAEGVSKIPMTDQWTAALKWVIRTVKNRRFMDMGGEFVSDDSELIVKGIAPVIHRGRVTCEPIRTPQYSVLPNGDVFFCCQSKCQDLFIGNLNRFTYQELVSIHKPFAKSLQSDSKAICRKCKVGQPIWKHKLMEFYHELFA